MPRQKKKKKIEIKFFYSCEEIFIVTRKFFFFLIVEGDFFIKCAKSVHISIENFFYICKEKYFYYKNSKKTGVKICIFGILKMCPRPVHFTLPTQVNFVNIMLSKCSNLAPFFFQIQSFPVGYRSKFLACQEQGICQFCYFSQ